MESSLTLDPDEEISKKVLTSCLIGKILLKTSFSTYFVKAITTSSWNCKAPFSVSLLDPKIWNTFVFTFDDKEDFMNVLLNSPWSVNGSLLVLSPWSSAKTCLDFHFSRSPFWVQVHGLPVEYITLKNGYEIGRELGIPIRVDHRVFDEVPHRRNVLRIRVSIDVTKPLKSGFMLKRGYLSGVWVDFKYERLFVFCYNCGRIGHTHRRCRVASTSAKFSPCLRASTPSDSRFYGVCPRVSSRTSACTDLVMLPQPGSMKVKEPIVEMSLMMQPGGGGDSSTGIITKSYLLKKFVINSIDSMVMVMNSSIIFSSACLTINNGCQWRLLLKVIIGYLIYLILKMRRVVRVSGFMKGYSVMVPLAEMVMGAFVEIAISVALFLILLV